MLLILSASLTPTRRLCNQLQIAPDEIGGRLPSLTKRPDTPVDPGAAEGAPSLPTTSIDVDNAETNAD